MTMLRTWLDEEPILTRIGPVVVAVVGYLAVRGILDADTANLILAIVAALAGTGGMLSARGRVWTESSLGSERD